jgi:TPR repeat protein
VKKEYEKAARVYEQNCETSGYGPSCFNLGRLYCKFLVVVVSAEIFILVLTVGGKGVKQSDEKAQEYLGKKCTSYTFYSSLLSLSGKACDKGHLHGCHFKAMFLYTTAKNLDNGNQNKVTEAEQLKVPFSSFLFPLFPDRSHVEKH